MLLNVRSVAETRNVLSKLFLLLIAAGIVTAIAYYLLLNIPFNPTPVASGGREVFLLPRFYLRQNDLESGIFASWGMLGLLLVVAGIILFLAFLASRRVKKFSLFLLVIFVLSLSLELLFVGLTANGFSHIELQAKSINNGIWYSLTALTAPTHPFSDLSLFSKVRYFFTVLCSTHAGYTIPGTSHPAGGFIITYAIYAFSSLFGNPPLAWGLIITVINTALVVVVGLIARLSFNRKGAQLAVILLMATPSVLIHFCAMVDVMASLFTALGVLMSAMFVRSGDRNRVFRGPVPLATGILAGLFFTIAAQFTYGHGIPILAALGAAWFMTRVRPEERKKFFLGVFFIPALYFIFELWMSEGGSFYVLRGFKIARALRIGLASRPYPLSQVANFTVMSVMGGVLYLPAVLSGVGLSWEYFRKRGCQAGGRAQVRSFLGLLAAGTLVFLVAQRSVRLEVERTWHWAFIPAWALMGIYAVSIASSCRRLFPGVRIRPLAVQVILVGIQMIVSIVLAVSIQDYY